MGETRLYRVILQVALEIEGDDETYWPDVEADVRDRRNWEYDLVRAGWDIDIVSALVLDDEALSARLHEIYQAEAHRRGDVRHADAYDDLPDDTKEWDRVLARWVIAHWVPRFDPAEGFPPALIDGSVVPSETDEPHPRG